MPTYESKEQIRLRVRRDRNNTLVNDWHTNANNQEAKLCI